jgi:hypothetical protein
MRTLRAGRLRLVLPVLVAGLVLVACGDGELTLTEYVDEINAAAKLAGERAEQLTSEGVLGADVDPQQLKAGLQRGLREIRIPLQESVETIAPPSQVAELHSLLWTWHAEFISVETTLLERVGETPDTAEGWTALSDSPQMAAYRESVAKGKQVCIDFQANLDATAARGEFEDVPWLPAKLKEVVVAALGCEWFPDDPNAIYQYPAP